MIDWRAQMRTGWWTPARRFIDCCGSVQPMLLNEAFRSPLQYDFLSFPFRLSSAI